MWHKRKYIIEHGEKKKKLKRINLRTPPSDPGPNRDHKKRKKLQRNEAGIIFGSTKQTQTLRNGPEEATA